MAADGGPSRGDSVGLLVEIARRYFIENETQDTIARALSLSRMKVNRLLREAQEEGLVEIRVRLHSSQTRDLEAAFARRFGLRHLLVAPEASAPVRQRAAVAGLVSNFLESTLRENAVVAIGMGRNVAAVAAAQAGRGFDGIEWVSASGGASEAGEEGNADHICRAFARRFGGTATTLYAPAYVPDPALREALMRHETVRRTLNRARGADVAIMGIGDLGPDSHMARMGWFSPDEIRQAQAEGVVGDLMGYDFFTLSGEARNERLGGRVIGLGREDLARIGCTIAVAAEPSKVTAILGALRTGVIDVLATSAPNCRAVLDLALQQDAAPIGTARRPHPEENT
ncbi:sugar-binding transcriptional regulator [Rubellimicrobium sp. CFH 75288]|uniref:sugar-binding transcriptional regulator n=1 Tax=Rubellimicrobium sp. CFH 75288 TaxID=2697034 RepID=UPI001412D429|nr:sugar-binding domain-containing protein [Rubellimicrobium sp. CFH 75288]NAZ36359.1 sugar-binding transcriptional regulator [Rubellimicrobium sp. CFH 75288]